MLGNNAQSAAFSIENQWRLLHELSALLPVVTIRSTFLLHWHVPKDPLEMRNQTTHPCWMYRGEGRRVGITLGV
jgi:hypothetical protein